MIIGNLAEYEHYFRTLVDQHPALKQFVVGDSERILSMDRSKLDYPVLWLETPSISWGMGEPAEVEFTGYFVVLINTRIDNHRRERYVLNQCNTLTQDVVSMMVRDARSDLFNLDINRIKSEPVLGYGVDNDYGWRTMHKISFPVKNCPAVADVYAALPAGALARFEWQNKTPGNFTDLEISLELTPSILEYSWASTEWRSCVDDNPVVESSDPPVNLGAGNNLRIVFQATGNNGSILVASAYFNNEVGRGTSVPYVLTKKDFI